MFYFDMQDMPPLSDIQEYMVGLYNLFHSNMFAILHTIPESGITYSTVVNSSAEELYEIFSEIEQVSEIMIEYVEGLDDFDIKVLSHMIDITNVDINAKETIAGSSSDILKYNFILICITYLQLVLIPSIVRVLDIHIDQHEQE